MPQPLAYAAALARIMEMSYPPTTLRLPPARAAGHRLVKPVIAKGNQPVRPIAHTDGLAVLMEDVTRTGAPQHRHDAFGPGSVEPVEAEAMESFGLTRHIAAVPGDTAVLEDETDGEDLAQLVSDRSPEEIPEQEAGIEFAVLHLRTSSGSGKREDALQPGEAIAVNAGAEVPRGADMVYPFSQILPPPEFDIASAMRSNRQPPSNNGTPGDDESEEDALPALEPQREWDLPSRYKSGELEVPLLAPRAARQMTAIGDWARNKEALFPERTILRAGELALLEALEIDEVEVYRKPVIGIASLAPPFPSPQHHACADEGQPTAHCPLVTLAVELARSARIAALPLGFAPRRFRPLVSAIEHWVEQVDILLLVGGSHHGPSCLALDALLGAGKTILAGVDLHPGGSISAGLVHERPVLSLPGSLADVLIGFVLFVRQLAHKYLLPANYTPTVDVKLDCASRIRVEQAAALPVRYGWDQERAAFCSRFSGRVNDGWLDYIRGQALIVFEPGSDYHDGDTFTAYAY